MTINSSTFDAAGDTDFLNTGTVILGNDATDVLTFAGGLATTGNDSNPGTLNVAGTINTTNTRMDIGAVTLTKATTFDTGNHADGVLNIGAVTSGTNSLTLDSGATAGATMNLTSMVDASGGLTIRDAGGLATIGDIGSGTAGAVTITDSTGGVTFSGNVDSTTLTITDTTDAAVVTFAQGGDVDITTSFDTANQGYAVTINSSTFDAAGDTDFLNTGTVILGNDATDVLTFAGGLATTGNDSNPGTVNAAGTINTTNTRMDIGAVTLTKATTFDTGNHADGVLNIGAVTSGTNSLTLDSGATAGATMSLTSMVDASGG